MSVGWEAAGASDVGRIRQRNEDSFLVDVEHGVFLVADGMGGHAAGEIASEVATKAVGMALVGGAEAGLQADELAAAMRVSFHLAHQAITSYSDAHPATVGMGTTMTACVVCTDGTYRLGHIGDSRAYVMRGGELAQVTRDHTWVQREVDEGRLTPVGARRHHLSHILTRALGADSTDDPDVYAGQLLPGDLLLLASDGLTGMLTDLRIARILAADGSVEDRVHRLIDAANDRGGRDNITAVLVRIIGPGEE